MKCGYATQTGKELSGTACAHRLAVILLLGPLKAGDFALHRCGNALCHNPYHLYVGGYAENQRDKLLHRQANPRWGPFGLTHQIGSHHVHMPQRLVLSEEPCRLATRFAGFTPGQCLHCEWLPPTFDGFRQVRETSLSGEIVGVHRRAHGLFKGPVDRYDIVSHTCGDPTCVNPFHLFIFGRQASHRDFDVKHDKRFRLSEGDLALIADFSRGTSELAMELGVHPQTVAGLRADLRRSLRTSR